MTRIARAPSSSASAIAIGPPIGSNTTTSPVSGSAGQPARSGRRCRSPSRRASISYARYPGTRAGALHDHRGGILRVRVQLVTDPGGDAEPIDSRVRAIRRAAGSDRQRRRDHRAFRPFDELDVVTARRLPRVPSPVPAGPPPNTTTCLGSVAGAYQSGSSVSRPLVGSPMHVTIGLRTSRTWHVWLHRVQGRISSRASRAAFRRGPARRSGPVSSRPRRTPPRRTVAERPLRLADVDDRTLQDDRHVDAAGVRIEARHKSMLKPAGSWKSGRVFSRRSRSSHARRRRSRCRTATRSTAMSGACSGVMPAHGASSSHESRSPTTRSATLARTASITSLAKRRRS